jgi:AcrR family transcriptional regulator
VRTDGERSREAILTAALSAVSTNGLEGLSIGALAERTGLSKSGLFAHFGSKQELQLATVRAAQALVERHVVGPARSAPPGVARLVALTESYLAYLERPPTDGGCILAALAAVNGVPPPVRMAVSRLERRMFACLVQPIRQAVRLGELAPATDPVQLGFEIQALLAAANRWMRVGGKPEGIARARRAIETLIVRAARS